MIALARRAETRGPRARRRRPARAGRTPAAQLALPGEMPEGWRPRTRADCVHVVRPCRYIGCEHNLYLTVDPETGEIRYTWPGLEPHEISQSCELDAIESAGGPLTLAEVALLMNLSKSNVGNVEIVALAKLSIQPPPRRLTQLEARRSGIRAPRPRTMRARVLATLDDAGIDGCSGPELVERLEAADQRDYVYRVLRHLIADGEAMSQGLIRTRRYHRLR